MIEQLEKGEQFFVLGAPIQAHEEFESYFKQFHQQRVQKEVTLNGLYKHTAEAYAKDRKKMKYTDIRYLPKKLKDPSWITLYHKTVLFFLVENNFKAIKITNGKLHRSLKEYYNMIWNAASPNI